jgi:hypothetical protein
MRRLEAAKKSPVELGDLPEMRQLRHGDPKARSPQPDRHTGRQVARALDQDPNFIEHG